MQRATVGFYGGVFLMSEVPLHGKLADQVLPVALVSRETNKRIATMKGFAGVPRP